MPDPLCILSCCCFSTANQVSHNLPMSHFMCFFHRFSLKSIWKYQKNDLGLQTEHNFRISAQSEAVISCTEQIELGMKSGKTKSICPIFKIKHPVQTTDRMSQTNLKETMCTDRLPAVGAQQIKESDETTKSQQNLWHQSVKAVSVLCLTGRSLLSAGHPPQRSPDAGRNPQVPAG